MIRKEAIEIISRYAKNNPIVSANGFISRDLFGSLDKESNFYMIGSMGLASSIGLGIALKNPKKTIFIFDGDGNILMNLGSLVTIGSLKPKNLIHVIFDNGSHESTGGQPTNISKINFEKICAATNYKIFRITTKSKLIKSLKNLEKLSGPILFHVQISSSKAKSKRMTIHPKTIRDRFTNSIK